MNLTKELQCTELIVSDRAIKQKIIKTTTKKANICKSDGYFPDRTSCSKYILCNGGTPISYTCGDGLVWDAEQQLCGWADTVECKNGKRPWESLVDSEGGNS